MDPSEMFVECSRCGADRLFVVFEYREDTDRPALWCPECGEPVAYPDEGAQSFVDQFGGGMDE